MHIQKKAAHAYIDAANLHQGVRSSGWKIDFPRFRVWLKDKYAVTTAFIFIGYIPKNQELYDRLRAAGFTLVFKEVVYHDGEAKGNCDTDLVLRALVDHYESDTPRAILVSSDGDYASLVNFFLAKQTPIVILSPRDAKKCSNLLRRTNAPITFLSQVKGKFSQEAP